MCCSGGLRDLCVAMFVFAVYFFLNFGVFLHILVFGGVWMGTRGLFYCAGGCVMGLKGLQTNGIKDQDTISVYKLFSISLKGSVWRCVDTKRGLCLYSG